MRAVEVRGSSDETGGGAITDPTQGWKNKLSNPEKENVDVNELGDEAADHVKNVVLGLGLGNGEYLIAIAWSTAEQVSQFL